MRKSIVLLWLMLCLAAPVSAFAQDAAPAALNPAQADAVRTQITQLDLLKTKIDEINALILKIRNRRLLDNILAKQSSILHPKEFWDSLTSFAGFVFELVKSPFSWYDKQPAERRASVNDNILLVIVGMLAALAGAGLLGFYIKHWFGYQESIEHPDYSQKVRARIWMFIARGAIPAALIGAFLFWLHGNPLINTDSFGLLLTTAAVGQFRQSWRKQPGISA